MIRLLSLFSGIGAFEKALDRIGAEYELVNYCEIDKYASASYAAVHGVSEELNLRDVQTIDCDKLKGKGVNLITYGFPCQDISVAGKMKGFAHDGQKTRSGLFFDALKVIGELQPEVAIAENVKALVGKKFEAEFAAVRSGLAEAGYNNYYAVLNASDYGIPQHRERVFIVSIRKDIDRDKFAFPQKEPLRLRVKDLLEYDVDEKYYIDTDRARELIRKLAEEGKLPGGEPAIAAMRGRDPENPSNRHSGVHTEQKMEVNTSGTSNTITTVQKDNHIIEPDIKTIGNLDGHEIGRILDTDGITQSLKGTDYKNPVKIALKQVGELGSHQTDRVYDPDGLSRALKSTDYTHPVNITEVKQVGNLYPEAKFNNTQRGRVYATEGCCPTINTMQGGNLEPKILQIGQLYSDNSGNLQNGRIYDPEGCSPALHTMQGGGQKEPKIIDIANDHDGCCKTIMSRYYKTSPRHLASDARIVSSGVIETVNTAQNEQKPPKILDVMNGEKDGTARTIQAHYYKTAPSNLEKTKDRGSSGVIEALNPEKDGLCRTLVSSYYKTSLANLESNLSRSSTGVMEKIDTGCKAVGDLKVGGERGVVYDAEKSMCTLSATQYKDPHKVLNEYRIRKLTPKECWRLMGFDDDDFEKAKAAGISNTQLYKQAGNSIVVQVLERIFEKLIETQGIGGGNE